MLAARLNEALNALQFMVQYSPLVPSTLWLQLWFGLSCVQVSELLYGLVFLRGIDVDFPIFIVPRIQKRFMMGNLF